MVLISFIVLMCEHRDRPAAGKPVPRFRSITAPFHPRRDLADWLERVEVKMVSRAGAAV
jgi:hypothetical protein